MNGWAVRHVTRTAGEIFLTVGVIGLLFISYLIWGTALQAHSAQRQLSNELNQQWSQRPGGAPGASPEQFNVATGQPFAPDPSAVRDVVSAASIATYPSPSTNPCALSRLTGSLLARSVYTIGRALSELTITAPSASSPGTFR